MHFITSIVGGNDMVGDGLALALFFLLLMPLWLSKPRGKNALMMGGKGKVQRISMFGMEMNELLTRRIIYYS